MCSLTSILGACNHDNITLQMLQYWVSLNQPIIVELSTLLILVTWYENISLLIGLQHKEKKNNVL